MKNLLTIFALLLACGAAYADEPQSLPAVPNANQEECNEDEGCVLLAEVKSFTIVASTTATPGNITTLVKFCENAKKGTVSIGAGSRELTNCLLNDLVELEKEKKAEREASQARVAALRKQREREEQAHRARHGYIAHTEPMPKTDSAFWHRIYEHDAVAAGCHVLGSVKQCKSGGYR